MLVEMAKTAKEKTIEVACPECGAMIRIDAATGALISHTPAPRKRMFEDFSDAAKAAREAEARRDQIFAQSVDAQKNKDDLMAKKFAEAVKKAKEKPDTGRPLREFDLD
jgi:Zn-dependent M28 family amino/carboxypeptidase